MAISTTKVITGTVARGLADPVQDSQIIFRAALEALSHPGRLTAIPTLPGSVAPLYASTLAVCHALVDLDTPLWLDDKAANSAVRSHVAFHCGCPIVTDRHDAAFAIIADPARLDGFDGFATGTQEYPDRSATLIMQVESIKEGVGKRLTGPGIKGETRISISGLSENFWRDVHANELLFPQGIDLLLTTPDAVLGLPRTTRVED